MQVVASPSRRPTTFVIASLVVFALVFLDRRNRPNFSDFDVYWIAGGKAARHQTVYDVEGHYQFKYSPFVATLWSMPTRLPASREVWRWWHWLATGTGFCVAWLLLARALDRQRALALWFTLLWVFVVGLRDELKLGQANVWPFLLVLPVFLTGGRPAAAGGVRRGVDWSGVAIGAAWALAIQWKLYALVLVPIWLLRRRVAVWVGVVCAMVATLVCVQALVHPWDLAIAENARWLRTLTQSSEQLLISTYNVSLLGILGKLAGTLGLWAYVLWGLFACAWVACLVWAERHARARDLAWLRFWSGAFAWAGITVLTPLAWPYWLLLCAPLFLVYVVMNTADGVRSADPGFWAVCALFVVMNWAQNHAVVHAGGSLLAILVLMADAFRRARHAVRVNQRSTPTSESTNRFISDSVPSM